MLDNSDLISRPVKGGFFFKNHGPMLGSQRVLSLGSFALRVLGRVLKRLILSTG